MDDIITEDTIILPPGPSGTQIVQAFVVRQCPGCERTHTVPAFATPPAEAISVSCLCGGLVTYGPHSTSMAR